MPREIAIQPVLNGFICRVGCQTVVFESREKLVEELGKYLANSKGTEKAYIENAVNPMPQDGPPQEFGRSIAGNRRDPRLPITSTDEAVAEAMAPATPRPQ